MSYLRFFIDNFFGTLVFYVTFQHFGMKPAIVLAVVTCFVQILLHRLRRQRFSPIFWFSNGITIFLGTADLMIRTPHFLMYDPALRSFIPGFFYLFSLAIRKPLAGPIMETMPGFLRIEPGELNQAYLMRITWLYTILTFGKTALFFFLAFEVNLGELWILKKLLGGGLVAAFFASEAVYRKWIRKKNPGSDRVPLPGI